MHTKPVVIEDNRIISKCPHCLVLNEHAMDVFQPEQLLGIRDINIECVCGQDYVIQLQNKMEVSE
ncbi:hypothetical protein Y489_12845 [Listeria monocytogenes]|nr:hypothetical protein [Listeria monocytogenes]